MKTLQIFLRVGAVFALLGFLNVATAEIKNESMKPLTFPIDVGDGSSGMPPVSFDSMGGAGNEEAQTTCAMTPGGTMPEMLLEEPVIPPPPSDEYFTNSPSVTLAPISSLQTPPPYDPRRNFYPPDTPTPPTPPPPPVVPEPATLLLVGLGIGAVALVTRRRDEKH